MAAYYGKSCVFDRRFLARKAKLDSINSISQNPHGWSSILRKFSVDPCFPLKLVIFYYTLVLFLLLTGTFEQLKTFASLELNFSGKRTYISNNGGFHVKIKLGDIFIPAEDNDSKRTRCKTGTSQKDDLHVYPKVKDNSRQSGI